MVVLKRSLLAATVAFAGLAGGLSDFSAYLSRREVTIEASSDDLQVDNKGAYMRAAKLENNDILGVYTVIDDSVATIRTVRSSDGAESWESLGSVSKGPSSTSDIDNAFPLQLPDGRLLVAFRNHNKEEGTQNSFTWYRITLCESTDGGKTWRYVSQIAERQATGSNGLWEPFLRLAEDGSLQAYYSLEHSSNDQSNVMKTSKDGGKTWSNLVQVSGTDADARDGMVGVADTGNGTLMCVFESTEIGRMSIHYVLSGDDGKTWNNRTLLYEAKDNGLAGAPQIINVGGTLVVSFMSTERRSSTDIDGGEQRIVTSSDGGATWGDPYVLSGMGSHWPGLMALNNDEFLSLYSTDKEGMLSHRHRVVADSAESGEPEDPESTAPPNPDDVPSMATKRTSWLSCLLVILLLG